MKRATIGRTSNRRGCSCESPQCRTGMSSFATSRFRPVTRGRTGVCLGTCGSRTFGSACHKCIEQTSWYSTRYRANRRTVYERSHSDARGGFDSPEFKSCFDRQRAAYFAAPEPSYAGASPISKLLATLLKENREALVAAINADYGNRSEFETLFAEYFVVLETVADAVKHLKKWMKPQRRHVDFMTYPLARNRVIPQPLGVVGVIVPWNFPLNLSFCPLAAILAAGNRAMVKMSENSKALRKGSHARFPKVFSDREACLFRGWRRARTGILVIALRPSAVHGIRCDRSLGHGQRGPQPHPCHA